TVRHPCFPRRDLQRRSQSLAPGGLPGHQKGARKLARAAELEGSKILVPFPIRYVGILCLPLSQVEQVILGNPALPRAVSEVSPLPPWKPLPLDFRHSSTAQDQSAELIHHSVLLPRIVLSKVLLQPLEELTFTIRLAFQANANERGNRLAHAGVNCLGVSFHLTANRGRKADAIPRSRLVQALRFRFAWTGFSAAPLRVCYRLRHIDSVCLSMHHCRNARVSSCSSRPARILLTDWPHTE